MLTSVRADVLVDFHPESKVRPKDNPYPVTITDLDSTPPAVSTTDRSKHVPVLTGSFRAGDSSGGSIILTLDGRSDDAASWVADTWSGGASFPVKGSEAGLGISDTVGGNKVDDGEAIIWSFDLSLLNLDRGESLVLTAADFGGEAEGEHAEFWRLTGKAGSKGAGTRIANGGLWTGEITIADGDEFALAGNGRLRSLTINIATPNSAPATKNTGTAPAISGKRYDPASTRNIIMILADDMAWYDTPVRMDDRLENSAQEIMRSLKDPENPEQLYKWNLQKLAEDGMLFRNAYSAAPQCTPTRACLQTGMTTARHRLSV